MIFSLLTIKALSGLFILIMSAYTGIFVNAFSYGRFQPDCKQFDNIPPHVCDDNYDPICCTNGKTYLNECQFCNVARDTLDTVEFKHYGRCFYVP